MDNFIQLKKDNILKIGIKDADGNDTGNHLEFDLEDVELPLRLQKCDDLHRKNVITLKNELNILDKKQDKKGKKLLSWKEEEKTKLIQEYFNKEIECLDLFLGEGGTLKLLNGRNPYITMFEDISEIIKPILPLIESRTMDIKDKIKNLYSKSLTNTEGDILTDE